MQYNKAESVTKALEAEGHKTVKLASQLAEGASDPADDRIYSVSVRGPVDDVQFTTIQGIAAEHGADAERHGDHGNVKID